MLIYIFFISLVSNFNIYFIPNDKKRDFGLCFDPKNQTQVTTYVTATTGA